MTEIFDRGNKKWVSLMIPELREGLRQIFQEKVCERPELDEQEMERLNRLLTIAYQTGRPVLIRYWDDNGEQEAFGRVIRFDMGQIRLSNEDGKIHILAEKIVDVIPA